MYLEPRYDQLQNMLKKAPDAHASIKGSSEYPTISGMVFFYQLKDGVMLIAQFQGLPQGIEVCSPNVFGFHIHEGNSCTGNMEDPFANTGSHYNPSNCPHPAHKGDLPPLFGNHGYAFMAFITDRFTVKEVIGHTVILHSSPDDFTTQPSGNSGKKIACGQILSNAR